MSAMQSAADPWDGDLEFENSVITEVSGDRETGWSVTKRDGWSFFVPADSPVVPLVDMPIRMYGKGIGYMVRGLFLDGLCVFYRSDAEQDEKTKDDLYGRDAADVLRRWDEGRGIWSIALGGFGPGYEQAIQCAAMEVLRHLVNGGAMEDADTILPAINYLGLSGSQWCAAKMLANAFHQKGPRQIHEDYPSDRHIQVCRLFPVRPDPVRDAGRQVLDALKEAIPYIEAEARRFHPDWSPDLADEDSVLGRCYAAIATAESHAYA